MDDNSFCLQSLLDTLNLRSMVQSWKIQGEVSGRVVVKIILDPKQSECYSGMGDRSNNCEIKPIMKFPSTNRSRQSQSKDDCSLNEGTVTTSDLSRPTSSPITEFDINEEFTFTTNLSRGNTPTVPPPTPEYGVILPHSPSQNIV